MKRLALGFLLLVAATAAAETVDHFGRYVTTEASMAECVTCHNGRTAAGVSRCDKRMCQIYARHLVDVRYPPTGKEQSYATTEEIEIRGFRLVNDRIACMTCHSLTSRNKYLLVTKADGDRFCKACHLL